MSLATYNKKRDFKQSSEPKGKKSDSNRFRFVVQRHDATRLHYDFRLELDGVLKSWAVPRGPSLDPTQRRLAVMVEDHPVDYINFKGIIPEGNYGAGNVDIWDAGRFTPVNAQHKSITEKEALQGIRNGELKFALQGKKLRGEFVLVRLKGEEKNWLLIKHRDEFAQKEDQKPAEEKTVKKSLPAKNNTTATGKKTAGKNSEEMIIGRHSVTITNRQKNYWPDEGLTKGDMIDYYDRIAPWILPHLKGRPLSLKRNPNGIRDAGFYHKDAGENTPDYVDVFKVHSESSNKIIDYIVCNNKAALLYVVNLGCIEINPWNSTTRAPGNPSWMVIDIDPSGKNTFTEVIDVALATKMILDKAGVKCFCKTSGSSGLHVYVPMKNKYDYDTVKEFAHIVAALVQEQLPGTTTLERSLSKRGPKIYIDYLQNRSGQTLASVYSLRPVPGAYVSTPLEWKEVNHRLTPSMFNIHNILKRVEKKGDLFLPVLSEQISLTKALKALQG
jgi:DNA ligase D-like protein (predicted polymerase)/DNA ligase D-like protein (predicted 3'-phosphoesterase)